MVVSYSAQAKMLILNGETFSKLKNENVQFPIKQNSRALVVKVSQTRDEV